MKTIFENVIKAMRSNLKKVEENNKRIDELEACRDYYLSQEDLRSLHMVTIINGEILDLIHANMQLYAEYDTLKKILIIA